VEALPTSMSNYSNLIIVYLNSHFIFIFLFLNFSGHGVQEADRDGDEDDGFDECLAPADYDVAGYISDDFLSRWLRDLPEHTCFAVFDCCHR
jgi:hypothetical protein